MTTGGSAGAQETATRYEDGRFTILAFPDDAQLARSLLRSASARDTFPGLPRSRDDVLVIIAPDRRRFRELIGSSVPEWGAAVAFPQSRRIVMQGRRASSSAGDPIRVLRHELAHLALFEALGDLPPRWFDEGYASFAAEEWNRDQVLATNVGLALRGMPRLDSLDAGFTAGAQRAAAAYAMSYRAVAELAALDPERGLSIFLTQWRETGRFDTAVRLAYGLTAAQFEDRWRKRTRRRYGALALFADLTFGSLLLVLLVGPLYVIRRRRDRRRMAALVRADAEADRREAAGAIEALLRSLPPAPPPRTPEDG
jgi:hypothetical protein